MQDVAERSGTSYPTAHRELRQLLQAGLVRERRVGQARMHRPNDESPYFRALHELIAVAFGPVPLLRTALEHVAAVEAVAIFGSFAERLTDQPGPPPADVDVLVIGSPDLSVVYEACGQVARQVDRPVNPTVFSLEEWRGNDPFVCQLRGGVLVPVIGESVLGDRTVPAAVGAGRR